MTDEQHNTAPLTLRALAARWFPLVPRSKPVCRSLDERVTLVCELARTASAGDDDSLARAAEALNLAALILSDCGEPELARDLCQRQARLLAAAPPHGLETAQLAIQPLVNIGRLLLRSGDPTACQYFQRLFDAVTARADTTIEGTDAHCSRLTASDTDHRALIQWLRPVVLADGTRALTTMSHWTQAVEHLGRHNGIGDRLLDGRQVLVLSLSMAHDHEAARQALPVDTPTTWEHVVKCCLHALIAALAGNRDSTITGALGDAYARLCDTDQPATFTTRLGICARTLAQGTSAENAIARNTISTALRSCDAYPARDVLSDPGCMYHATPEENNALTETMQAAGIGQGQPQRATLRRLTHAVKTSEAAITARLATAPQQAMDRRLVLGGEPGGRQRALYRKTGPGLR